MNENQYGIPTSYNDSLIQQALKAGDTAISQQRHAAFGAIGNSEQQMYEMLGKMQLQNEQSIADRRMKALRSGTTSSGLAALEMQNIQAGAIGAQTIMRDVANQRLEVEQQYAGKEQMNRQYMLEMLNQNTKDIAAIDAQKYSSNIIPGIQQLYPDAPADVISVLAKDFQGINLSADEQGILDDYRNGLSGNTVGTNSANYNDTQLKLRDTWGLSDEEIQDMYSANNFLTWDEFKKKEKEYKIFSIFSGKAEDRKAVYDAYVKEYNKLHNTGYSR